MMESLSKKFKISRSTRGGPIYIYRFSISKHSLDLPTDLDQDEWMVDWTPKEVVTMAHKKLASELRRSEMSDTMVDVDSSTLYTLCDFRKSRYATNDRNTGPRVNLTFTQHTDTYEHFCYIEFVRVHSIELKMLGSPIYDLSDQVAARPEVQRAINHMILAEFKQKSKTSFVRLSQQNVGRVFKIKNDDKQIDGTTVTKLSDFASTCRGFATSVHQVVVPADSPQTGNAGLELKITEDLGCFVGTNDMLKKMNWPIPFWECRLDDPQLNALKEWYIEQLIIEIRLEGGKFFIKVMSRNRKLLLEQEFEERNLEELPDTIKMEYEKCSLTKIGCLLPAEVMVPGQILEKSLTKEELGKSDRPLDERRELFGDNCAKLIEHRRDLYLERFGFSLEPIVEEASEEQSIEGDNS